MSRLFTRASSESISLAGAGNDLTSKFSLSAWFYITAAPGSGNEYVIASREKDITDINYQIGYYQDVGGTRIRTLWTSPAASYIIYHAGNSGVTTSAWHHVLVTIDWSTNPDTIATYVDGVSIGMSQPLGGNNATPSVGATQTIKIGGNASTSYFDGQLAEVTCFNTYLGQQEATALYNRADVRKIRPITEVEWCLRLRGDFNPEPDWGPNRNNSASITGTSKANHCPTVARIIR